MVVSMVRGDAHAPAQFMVKILIITRFWDTPLGVVHVGRDARVPAHVIDGKFDDNQVHIDLLGQRVVKAVRVEC